MGEVMTMTIFDESGGPFAAAREARRKLHEAREAGASPEQRRVLIDAVVAADDPDHVLVWTALQDAYRDEDGDLSDEMYDVLDRAAEAAIEAIRASGVAAVR
jgi:hypothetical protein